MRKHLSAIPALAAMLLSCRFEPEEQRPDVLKIAEDHARVHYPDVQIPKTLGRQWVVEDHGDIWIVEIGEQNMLGGGVKMAIRKEDNSVLGAELTQ